MSVTRGDNPDMCRGRGCGRFSRCGLLSAARRIPSVAEEPWTGPGDSRTPVHSVSGVGLLVRHLHGEAGGCSGVGPCGVRGVSVCGFVTRLRNQRTAAIGHMGRPRGRIHTPLLKPRGRLSGAVESRRRDGMVGKQLPHRSAHHLTLVRVDPGFSSLRAEESGPVIAGDACRLERGVCVSPRGRDTAAPGGFSGFSERPGAHRAPHGVAVSYTLLSHVSIVSGRRI